MFREIESVRVLRRLRELASAGTALVTVCQECGSLLELTQSGLAACPIPGHTALIELRELGRQAALIDECDGKESTEAVTNLVSRATDVARDKQEFEKLSPDCSSYRQGKLWEG